MGEHLFERPARERNIMVEEMREIILGDMDLEYGKSEVGNIHKGRLEEFCGKCPLNFR